MSHELCVFMVAGHAQLANTPLTINNKLYIIWLIEGRDRIMFLIESRDCIILLIEGRDPRVDRQSATRERRHLSSLVTSSRPCCSSGWTSPATVQRTSLKTSWRTLLITARGGGGGGEALHTTSRWMLTKISVPLKNRKRAILEQPIEKRYRSILDAINGFGISIFFNTLSLCILELLLWLKFRYFQYDVSFCNTNFENSTAFSVASLFWINN